MVPAMGSEKMLPSRFRQRTVSVASEARRRPCSSIAATRIFCASGTGGAISSSAAPKCRNEAPSCEDQHAAVTVESGAAAQEQNGGAGGEGDGGRARRGGTTPTPRPPPPGGG